ncbi:hypothetical protein JTB14_034077 [Gonioctena quinquepunctata]|nr:hypothetical protein JTB14_034077 [Gonioctena quinquepunctata]
MATWKDNMPKRKPRLHEEDSLRTECRVSGHCSVQINPNHDATRHVTSSEGRGHMSVPCDEKMQPCATSKRESVNAQANKKMETESKAARRNLEGRSQRSGTFSCKDEVLPVSVDSRNLQNTKRNSHESSTFLCRNEVLPVIADGRKDSKAQDARTPRRQARDFDRVDSYQPSCDCRLYRPPPRPERAPDSGYDSSRPGTVDASEATFRRTTIPAEIEYMFCINRRTVRPGAQDVPVINPREDWQQPRSVSPEIDANDDAPTDQEEYKVAIKLLNGVLVPKYPRRN